MNEEFFNREADKVARELLGKILIRRVGDRELRAKIVETEAYFDEKDPASRACQNGDLRETMMMKPGTILVYGVHNSWLINFITDNIGKASAVLIRAIEPLNFEGRCNGPGLLTESLGIDKSHHKKSVIDKDEIWVEDIDNSERDTGNKFPVSSKTETQKLKISDPSTYKKLKSFGDEGGQVSESSSEGFDGDIEIVESFRIGVTEDLGKPMRFYIKDNKWVSGS